MKKRLHNGFVPHEGNGFAPTILQKTAMVGMTILVILSFIMSSFYAYLWQNSEWLVGAVLPAVVTTLTNSERATYAAPALQRNSLLDEAARLKAEHMAAEGYFAHYSPGGISPWHWFERVGYIYAHAGENLAVHFNDSADVVQAWMNSPTHKANIVNAKYSEIGIGVARGRYEGFDTVFVVQLFGTPAERPRVASTGTFDVIPVQVRELAVESVEEEVVVAEEFTVPDSVSATLELGESNVRSSASTAPTAVAGDFEEKPSLVESDLILPTEEEIIEILPEEKPVRDSQQAYFQLDFISTSSGLLPTAPNMELLSAGTSAPMLATLATQPHTILRYVYSVLGVLVITGLFTSVIVGWRRHRVREVWFGVILLLVMAGLFYLHLMLTGGGIVI